MDQTQKPTWKGKKRRRRRDYRKVIQTQRERQEKEEDSYVGESKRSDRGSFNVCVFTKMPS